MDLSPVVLTSDEARNFIPIYLDMASHCLIIQDPQGFLGGILQKVKQQMARWGS